MTNNCVIRICNERIFKRQPFPTFEFHIAKEVRKKYEFDDSLFSINGNVVFADFHSVRLFVQKINSKRNNDDKIKTGQVNAAALLDEIYHFIFRIYEIEYNPGVFNNAVEHLHRNLGEEETRKVLFEFVSLFPPMEVYHGRSSVFDYLNSYTADRSNVEIALEELILLFFANINPSNKNILELFDQNYFVEKDLYNKIISELDKFFQNEKKIGHENQDIFTFLKTPIVNNPDDIEAQLDFIREKWGILLDEKFLRRILSSKDLSKEDFVLGFGGGGGAPVAVPKYKGEMDEQDFLVLGKSGYQYALESWKDFVEPENFTPDTDWMPRVVMIAKNIYVWLDQLSKKYQRNIRTLDQMPDEELDQLAQWGFNGLWLIGIWERSNASKKIKHILGNIDAVSSAYSLYDYQIAWDLGGEYAYNNLNERARKRGIRLASDMVPNHTGIFSKWVGEHPDYFIQSSYPPFPNYRFSGPDLSDDPSIQLRIEDGYWSRSDAAVVFQRIDNRTGEIRYIYHGNDGTNMPWNDTAQLNMVSKEVREAVIQKIFEVARKFSIIRFDAAMTLTKRHFSRLWYPQPGKGGDIPSRSDFAMTQKEFDKLFTEEFWREVVDRINSEMPDTLLLAEAFWLMEGYFVRSLGMHRVYNSAFMHMMMKEENVKYRDLISNTLEFEPEILKRYVNFMSNPDEETAIKQFGTDDKYFGVCLLMVTLPGLPMFAHGQIEGFTEKYGMEYQRAYYHEIPNQWLIERHQREIFPLMKRRYLFSQVATFWLFDFIDNNGHVNENVFAFSNSAWGQRAIVFYNNKFEQAKGKIFRSSPKLVDKQLRTKTLSETLDINASPNYYYIFREHISNLEFLKSGRAISSNGFYIELGAFKYHVYLDFREVFDESGDYARLDSKLSGRGVSDIERALKEMKLEPIHNAFEKMFDSESINGFIKTCILEDGKEKDDDKLKFIDNKFSSLLLIIKNYFNLKTGIDNLLKNFDKEIQSVEKINLILENEFPIELSVFNKEIHRSVLISKDTNYNENSILFMIWLVTSAMKELFVLEGDVNQSNYINKMLLDTPVKNILNRLGRGTDELNKEINLLNILFKFEERAVELFVNNDQAEDLESEYTIIEKKFNIKFLAELLEDDAVRNFLGVNEYEGVTYYSKENFEELLDWFYAIQLLKKCNTVPEKAKGKKEKTVKLISDSFSVYKLVKEISAKSEYKFDRFIEDIKK